jgi:pimeloyl-ACP methyl ester carboxylesterase
MQFNVRKLPWPAWVAMIAGVVLLVAAIVFAKSNAAGTYNHGLESQLQRGSVGTKTLIVLMHGYNRQMGSMHGVQKAALDSQPGADVLRLGFASEIFSNADAAELAAQLNEHLEQLQAENGYHRVILCGFSMGALIVRKAYVYGCGHIEDAPGISDSRATRRERAKWVDHVERFVLLAGMNRGFSVETIPDNPRPLIAALRRFGIFIAKLSGTGRLAQQCAHGAPFVANLRLQWLDLIREDGRAQRKPPMVIQLLGSNDDVVSKEDSRDVTVSQKFIWVPVNNTGHADIIELGDASTGPERKRKIGLAFGDEKAIAELQRLSPATQIDQDPDVKTVVFVLHGIRDMGEWTSKFEGPLQQAFAKLNPGSSAKLHVHRASYGYFGMLPFVLTADRQKNVRWFMDEVTDLMARFPNMEEIHFIGRSYGTYVVASALEKYRTLHINQVVLAGCVLPRSYKWSALTGRVGAVRHYVGGDDAVVGLLPKLFELPLFNLVNRDIGGAGFDGFTDGFLKGKQTYFVRGGHSGALKSDNVESIVAFVMNHEVKDAPSRRMEAHPGWLALLSNVCWIAWLAGVALIVAFGWVVPHLVNWVTNGFSRTPPASRRRIWISRTVYAGFLLLLLYTI